MLRPKDLCQGSGTKTFLDAMHNGKAHLARFVLDALDGRIINSKTENNRTLLMYAVCLPDPAARVKFTHLLLEKGADVNCQDEHGRTALSLTCELGHLDAVKLLVQYNADPEITDTWGNSALMYAACAGHSQVLEFLVRAFKRLGLRLDRTNLAGHSALEVADFFGHNQCILALHGPGKKILATEDQGGGVRRPNRLPKQVLERFSRQFHSKCDEHLPAMFQRQLRVGEGNGSPRRLRAQRSPEKMDQTRTNQLQRLFSRDSKLIDSRGAKALDHTPELCKEDKKRDDPQEVVPTWGKAKSFNMEFQACRKQSFQDDMSNGTQAAITIKRGSLQDEQALTSKIQENASLTNDADKLVGVSHVPLMEIKQSLEPADDNLKLYPTDKPNSNFSGRREFQKRPSIPQYGRQDKLLSQRDEIAPEKIPVRPPGFTGLGTRLLRRFTAPEFMRLVLDFPPGSDIGRGKMSRSETFPLSHTHQKVDSQPSVDSISAVNCEFDSAVNLRKKLRS
ncbi:POTE ankyrin domain family member B3 [Brienomyrus brachyistius]|uniref:POTE ankyrin domain family member B3 n=1 Tax=Brienomyrus brachyistius TaxID=42636 RepID=UPI0020B1EFC3|nr:POTE ankyrin domain family member B3 [Brienomyrus brachyistius]